MLLQHADAHPLSHVYPRKGPQHSRELSPSPFKAAGSTVVSRLTSALMVQTLPLLFPALELEVAETLGEASTAEAGKREREHEQGGASPTCHGWVRFMARTECGQ